MADISSNLEAFRGGNTGGYLNSSSSIATIPGVAGNYTISNITVNNQGLITAASSTPADTEATANTLVLRDANANTQVVSINEVIFNPQNVVQNLTAASGGIIQLVGNVTNQIVLPDATTLRIGHTFLIYNNSNINVDVVDFNDNILYYNIPAHPNAPVAPDFLVVDKYGAGPKLRVICIGNGDADGQWDVLYSKFQPAINAYYAFDDAAPQVVAPNAKVTWNNRSFQGTSQSIVDAASNIVLPIPGFYRINVWLNVVTNGIAGNVGFKVASTSSDLVVFTQTVPAVATAVPVHLNFYTSGGAGAEIWVVSTSTAGIDCTLLASNKPSYGFEVEYMGI